MRYPFTCHPADEGWKSCCHLTETTVLGGRIPLPFAASLLFFLLLFFSILSYSGEITSLSS